MSEAATFRTKDAAEVSPQEGLAPWRFRAACVCPPSASAVRGGKGGTMGRSMGILYKNHP